MIPQAIFCLCHVMTIFISQAVGILPSTSYPDLGLFFHCSVLQYFVQKDVRKCKFLTKRGVACDILTLAAGPCMR